MQHISLEFLRPQLTCVFFFVHCLFLLFTNRCLSACGFFFTTGRVTSSGRAAMSLCPNLLFQDPAGELSMVSNRPCQGQEALN